MQSHNRFHEWSCQVSHIISLFNIFIFVALQDLCDDDFVVSFHIFLQFHCVLIWMWNKNYTLHAKLCCDAAKAFTRVSFDTCSFAPMYLHLCEHIVTLVLTHEVMLTATYSHLMTEWPSFSYLLELCIHVIYLQLLSHIVIVCLNESGSVHTLHRTASILVSDQINRHSCLIRDRFLFDKLSDDYKLFM